MTLPLSDRHRRELRTLLDQHRAGQDKLRELWLQYQEDPEADDPGDIPGLEKAADALVSTNHRLVEWNDRVLSQLQIWSEPDGFLGAPSLSITTEVANPDVLPSYKEGEEFVPSEEPEIEDLVTDDDDEMAYLAELDHLSRTGYPKLSPEARELLQQLLRDSDRLRELLHLLLKNG